MSILERFFKEYLAGEEVEAIKVFLRALCSHLLVRTLCTIILNTNSYSLSMSKICNHHYNLQLIDVNHSTA